MKITQDRRAASQPWGLRRVLCIKKNNALLFGDRGVVGWAGNSGFQAINLAVQFGARRIALCGFDFSMIRGAHWHGRHPSPLTNPNESALEKWRKHLDDQADTLRARGVEVIVATPDSRLTNYARRPLLELIDDAHLPV